MDEYLARLCWNSKGWTAPTGEAAKSEAAGNYATQCGFGHEEWLFDPMARLDGWRYAFLQPVNRSRDRLMGAEIDVRLFTISPEKRRFYVAHIAPCEVLTHEQSAVAWSRFRRQGRVRNIKQQLRALDASKEWIERIDEDWTLNVRWREGACTIHTPMLEAPKDHAVFRINRYALSAIRNGLAPVRSQWPDGMPPEGVWPDDVPPNETYVEGAARATLVNGYERDPRVRAACLAHHGRSCCVCGMDFGRVYGRGFENIIHVHHLRPLAEVGESRVVDPVRDLRPVCPNCHTALHRKVPPYTPEELKRVLRVEA